MSQSKISSGADELSLRAPLHSEGDLQVLVPTDEDGEERLGSFPVSSQPMYDAAEIYGEVATMEKILILGEQL